MSIDFKVEDEKVAMRMRREYEETVKRCLEEEEPRKRVVEFLKQNPGKGFTQLELIFRIFGFFEWLKSWENEVRYTSRLMNRVLNMTSEYKDHIFTREHCGKVYYYYK